MILYRLLEFAADKGFVAFNRAGKLFKSSALHSQADTMKQKPGGFLRDADSAMNLIRANAIFRIANEPHRTEPFIKSDRRIFHHRSKFNGEHLLTVFALPGSACGNEGVTIRAATRAGNDAIRPAKLNHKTERVVRIGEEDNSFLKSAGELFAICD